VIVAIAGGVGAARLLRGLIRVVDPAALRVIVNTGDDTIFHGLHVSPDVDTVVYTTSGAIDPERGWGLAGESWTAMGALARYGPHGAVTWFNLGDRDLATHLWRTGRLREGASLTDVTASLAQAWDLGFRLLPMSDDRVSTMVNTAQGELAFQEYFVRHQHSVPVTGVRFDGIEIASPGPDVLSSLEVADAIVVCPSNPIVSIGPVLAVPGIRSVLERRRDRVVAVSPIVAGAALKGPADRMLIELGHEASVVGVARLYAPFCSVLVIDQADAGRVAEVEACGIRAVVTDTIMRTPEVAAALSATALAALDASG
jgi:LPPG:FO 2-phospho-L-lactate transferase